MTTTTDLPRRDGSSPQHGYYAVRKGFGGVRSCIFLFWDDCRRYVECEDSYSEYEVFDGLEDAATYLLSAAALADNKSDGFPSAPEFGPSAKDLTDASDRGVHAKSPLRRGKSRKDGKKSPPGRRKEGGAETRVEEAEDNKGDSASPTQKDPRPYRRGEALSTSAAAATEEDDDGAAGSPPLRSLSVRRRGKRTDEDVGPDEAVDDRRSSSGKQNARSAASAMAEDDDAGHDADSDMRKKVGEVGGKDQRGRNERPAPSAGQKRRRTSGDGCTETGGRPRAERNRRTSVETGSKSQKVGRRGAPDNPDRKWNVMFEKLRLYQSAHGTLDVSREHDAELFAWVGQQRHIYNDGKDLTEERVRCLQDLGFEFQWSAPVKEKWDAMFEKLRSYCNEHGTLDVQKENDAELFAWVTQQHCEYKHQVEGKCEKSKLTEERFQRLRDLGFDFRHQSFEERLEQLKQYKHEFGDCEVPLKGHRLSRWMNATRQRAASLQMGKPSSLTVDQLKQLQALGFQTSKDKKGEKDDALFEEMMMELRKYKANHGDCLVPVNGSPLGKWVFRQRQDYKALQEGKPSRMTLQRIQRLTDIGFVFCAQKGQKYSWEERLEQLRQYKEEHGDLRVPKSHVLLGNFVGQLRYKYRLFCEGEQTSMTEERIRQLEQIGFLWLIGKRAPPGTQKNKPTWDDRLQELLEFKETFGHTVVPQHYPSLGYWVNRQRTEYKRLKEGKPSSLNTEKVTRLVDIGFVFDAMYRRGCKLGEDLREVDGGGKSSRQGGGAYSYEDY